MLSYGQKGWQRSLPLGRGIEHLSIQESQRSVFRPATSAVESGETDMLVRDACRITQVHDDQVRLTPLIATGSDVVSLRTNRPQLRPAGRSSNI